MFGEPRGKKKQTNTKCQFCTDVNFFQNWCWGLEQAHRTSAGLIRGMGCQKGTVSGIKVSENHSPSWCKFDSMLPSSWNCPNEFEVLTLWKKKDVSWTYHPCFDSWIWKLNLWLYYSPRCTNILTQWLHLLSPSGSKCFFLSTSGKVITGKNNYSHFWPN